MSRGGGGRESSCRVHRDHRADFARLLFWREGKGQKSDCESPGQVYGAVDFGEGWGSLRAFRGFLWRKQNLVAITTDVPPGPSPDILEWR